MSLRDLAHALGVYTSYVDGLGRRVQVADETLVRVCAALGAPLARAGDAERALRAMQDGSGPRLPSVLVAWNGRLDPVPVAGGGPATARLDLEEGGDGRFDAVDGAVHVRAHLPWGYHRLTVESAAGVETAVVISTPNRAWHPRGAGRTWGVGVHMAALRAGPGGGLGGPAELIRLGRWIGSHGGGVVTVLPLLPTFNRPPAEPSPYAPVSRLFWSELLVDPGPQACAPPTPATLDLGAADAAVRRALAQRGTPGPEVVDDELAAYARFRGAQSRLGRDWRAWPASARRGGLGPADVDPEEERFHLTAQVEARKALGELDAGLAAGGVTLGLDLAVGVHPDGYDVWSRQHLFAQGVSVGAPPDPGFPSGQDWGFPPVLPTASAEEGHRYLAASIAHQASAAGVLRVDHVMALARLYWIPLGMELHEGTYVSYPADELFAILTLESHRNRCRIVGEDLGTVPAEVRRALSRHGIPGMHLAQFEAYAPDPTPPGETQVALVSSHDTPTLAGWLQADDVHERARCGLLAHEAVPPTLDERAEAVARLGRLLGADPADPDAFRDALLEWLATSASPLVVPWIEDLWMERAQVNLPGTGSDRRPNWVRPMSRTLDEIVSDPAVAAVLQRLDAARRRVD